MLAHHMLKHTRILHRKFWYQHKKGSVVIGGHASIWSKNFQEIFYMCYLVIQSETLQEYGLYPWSAQ